MINPELSRALNQGIESRREELNALLQRLIQIRSYSGQEQEAVEFTLKKMGEYGFEECFCDGLGNAVGRIGRGKIKLLYDAHLDTVELGPEEGWAHPPLEGRITNGTIHGRGAVDEKPAMAGYLLAGRVLREAAGHSPLPFTLYVVGSVMEEPGEGYSLQHLVEQEGLRPDYVLLGEPTDLRVFRGQRGRLELEIVTRGKAAHGAHNELGINAIYKMAPILEEIKRLDGRLAAAEPLGKGSITVSQIESRAPSLCSVPDLCRIHLDRRLTVGETREQALAQVEEILRDCGLEGEIRVPRNRGISWKGTSFSQDAYFPSWILEEDHPLVRAAAKTAAGILGRTKPGGFWSFSTNGVATAGRRGIPTIGFAPGREELAHSNQEALVLADLLQAAKFYARFPFILLDELGTQP